MSRLALVFPGQGAQAVGMGKDFHSQFPAAKRLYERASRVLGFDLAEVSFFGPEERLLSTDISQPAILVASLAAFSALQERLAPISSGKLDVLCTGGLSLGESTALAFAGALHFEDAVRLVYRRGQFMQEACNAHSGGMVSVMGLSEEEVKALALEASSEGAITLSNMNCPGQIVLSGHKEAVTKVVELVGARGNGQAVELKVAGAFHSSLMTSASEKFAREIEAVEFLPPKVPVVSSVTGDFHRSPGEIRSLLVEQLTRPVLWEKCVRRMMACGAQSFLEVGPGKVLSGLIRRIDRSLNTYNIDSVRSLEKVVTILNRSEGALQVPGSTEAEVSRGSS